MKEPNQKKLSPRRFNLKKFSLRKLIRWFLLICLILIGILITTLFLHRTLPPRSFSSKLERGWLYITARMFGVKIKTVGEPLTDKTLFVANHLSWLDILVLGSQVPVHFLSKHEVAEMPVIGWLATRAGTLYIQRGNKNSASDAIIEITRALQQNNNCLVFAEGTTTDGHVRKFHSRTLQSAIDAGAMVQPVAIFYPVKKPGSNQVEINPAVLFTGDTTIGESADRIMRTPAIDVEVHFLRPINSAGQSRDELALHAFEEVVTAIEKIRG